MAEKIYFITGNKNKFNEVKQIIPQIEQIDIDLPEIQELDTKKIIEAKLDSASKENPGRKFLCEDVSLCINCLNGLPGPLIKWFLKTIGTQGIYNLIKDFNNKSAIAKSVVGFSDRNNLVFFEGELEGEIVKPKIKGGYGWDSIFKPKNSDKVFSEIGSEIRPMRKEALIKLKKYLNSRK